MRLYKEISRNDDNMVCTDVEKWKTWHLFYVIYIFCFVLSALITLNYIIKNINLTLFKCHLKCFGIHETSSETCQVLLILNNRFIVSPMNERLNKVHKLEQFALQNILEETKMLNRKVLLWGPVVLTTDV